MTSGYNVPLYPGYPNTYDLGGILSSIGKAIPDGALNAGAGGIFSKAAWNFSANPFTKAGMKELNGSAEENPGTNTAPTSSVGGENLNAYGGPLGHQYALGGLGAIGSAVSGAVGGAVSNGYSSGAGSIMNGLGDIASKIPGPWGAVSSAGLKVVGGLTNAAFGTKVDEKKLKAANEQTAALQNFSSNATSFDDVKGVTATSGVGQVYKGGLFNKGKARRENEELNRQRREALSFANRSVENNIDNIADTQMDNLAANFAAHGGPLGIWGGYGSGAIGYEFGNEYLNNQKMSAIAKYRLTSLPNSFQALPEMNTHNAFEEGGWLGTGINENVATAASFLPVVGTVMDGAEFINDPSWENAGWFLGGLASDIFTGGAGRAALKGVKLARRTAKVAKALKAKRLEAALKIGNQSYSTSMKSYRKAKALESKANQDILNGVGKIAGIQGADILLNATQQNTKAFGGDLNTHGSDFTSGQIIVGNGGTHEENPMEGVPMGMDAEGNPNLVEQGEVIFNDYVFSNRLFADGGLLESFNLPKSYDGHSFAAIAEKLGDESKERPNDPISKRGLLSSMSKLQQAQETVRQQTQEGQEGVQYAHGGRMGTLFDGFGDDPNILFPTSAEDWAKLMETKTPKYGVDWDLTGKVSTIVGESPKGMTTFNTVPTSYWEALGKGNKKANTYISNKSDSSSSKSDDDNRGSSGLDWLRYAPVAGAAIGLGQNLFSRPDYTSADTILEAANQAGNYTPIGYTPIGNYLQYSPFDRNFYLNKLNAQAGATRRTIMNTTSPSRNAALLAADYNAQGRLGDLARQAEEYNLAQRQAVETFNRGTNQANAEMGLKAAMANQEAALRAGSSRLSGVAQAMAVRDSVDARRGASMSANLTNFFNSLGDIGREEYGKNMIMSNPALYYSIDSSGNVTYKNGYENLSEAEKKEVRDTVNKAKKKKKAKGGYLTIKKK